MLRASKAIAPYVGDPSGGGSPAGYEMYEYYILEAKNASWLNAGSPNVSLLSNQGPASGEIGFDGISWGALSSGNTDAIFFGLPLQGGYDNSRQIQIRGYWTSKASPVTSPQVFGYSGYALSDHNRFNTIVYPASVTANDVINNQWDCIVATTASITPSNTPNSFDFLAIRVQYLGNGAGAGQDANTLWLKALVAVPTTL